MEMDIDPQATIGPGFYIGHIGGVHINPGAVIGRNFDCAHRVTSGASVPDDLVQGVLDLLVEQGYPAAREERLTEESLVFALPPELRRGLKRNVKGD